MMTPREKVEAAAMAYGAACRIQGVGNAVTSSWTSFQTALREFGFAERRHDTLALQVRLMNIPQAEDLQ